MGWDGIFEHRQGKAKAKGLDRIWKGNGNVYGILDMAMILYNTVDATKYQTHARIA